jgi:choline dehydrogenase-like flavoprotein
LVAVMVTRLRVADASIMPVIINANTNATLRHSP